MERAVSTPLPGYRRTFGSENPFIAFWSCIFSEILVSWSSCWSPSPPADRGGSRCSPPVGPAVLIGGGIAALFSLTAPCTLLPGPLRPGQPPSVRRSTSQGGPYNGAPGERRQVASPRIRKFLYEEQPAAALVVQARPRPRQAAAGVIVVVHFEADAPVRDDADAAQKPCAVRMDDRVGGQLGQEQDRVRAHRVGQTPCAQPCAHGAAGHSHAGAMGREFEPVCSIRAEAIQAKGSGCGAGRRVGGHGGRLPWGGRSQETGGCTTALPAKACWKACGAQARTCHSTKFGMLTGGRERSLEPPAQVTMLAADFMPQPTP